MATPEPQFVGGQWVDMTTCEPMRCTCKGMLLGGEWVRPFKMQDGNCPVHGHLLTAERAAEALSAMAKVSMVTPSPWLFLRPRNEHPVMAVADAQAMLLADAKRRGVELVPWMIKQGYNAVACVFPLPGNLWFAEGGVVAYFASEVAMANWWHDYNVKLAGKWRGRADVGVVPTGVTFEMKREKPATVEQAFEELGEALAEAMPWPRRLVVWLDGLLQERWEVMVAILGRIRA